MAPLTIPQRPQGGLRAPFLDYPPGCVSAFESAGGAIYTGRLHCRAIAPEARAVDVSCLLRGKALRCCPCLLEGWFLGSAVSAKT